MTGVDITIIAIVGISTLVSLLRGLVRELLSLVGLVASSILTVAFFEPVKDYMQKSYFESQSSGELIASGVAGVSLFLGFAILFGIMNIFIVKMIRASGYGFIDRSLGMLFGLLRGAFLVSLVFLVFTRVVDEEVYPKPLKEAQTLGALKFGSNVLENFIPEEYKKRIDAASAETKKQVEEQKKNQELKDLKDKTISIDDKQKILDAFPKTRKALEESNKK